MEERLLAQPRPEPSPIDYSGITRDGSAINDYLSELIWIGKVSWFQRSGLPN